MCSAPTSPTSQAAGEAPDGGNANTLCFNNPDYRNWLLGAVEDYARSYEIDGIMWGSERQGAFSNALGASHGGGARDPRTVPASANSARAKASGRGIDPERAQAGFQALDAFVAAAAAGTDRSTGITSHLAADVAPPGTARLGDALDRQPARNLRRHVQQSEGIEAVDR